MVREEIKKFLETHWVDLTGQPFARREYHAPRIPLSEKGLRPNPHYSLANSGKLGAKLLAAIDAECPNVQKYIEVFRRPEMHEEILDRMMLTLRDRLGKQLRTNEYKLNSGAANGLRDVIQEIQRSAFLTPGFEEERKRRVLFIKDREAEHKAAFEELDALCDNISLGLVENPVAAMKEYREKYL